MRIAKRLLAGLAAALFAGTRPRPGNQLRHHLDRQDRGHQATCGSRSSTTCRRRPASRSTRSSPPTTPASSRRSASTRCRSPGTATRAPSRRSTAPNGEVFAQFIDLDGTPGYYSYVHHAPRQSRQLARRHVQGAARSSPSARATPTRPPAPSCPGYYVFTQRGVDPKDVVQGGAARQPRRQPARRAQQAGGRRDEQQRGTGQAQAQGSRQARRGEDPLDVAAHPVATRSCGARTCPRIRR